MERCYLLSINRSIMTSDFLAKIINNVNFLLFTLLYEHSGFVFNMNCRKLFDIFIN